MKRTDTHIDIRYGYVLHCDNHNANVGDEMVEIIIDPTTAITLEKALCVLNHFTARFDDSRMGEFIMRLRDVVAKIQ